MNVDRNGAAHDELVGDSEGRASTLARRKLLAAAAAGGVTLVLQASWQTPRVAFGILPAHAMTSNGLPPPVVARPDNDGGTSATDAGAANVGSNNPFLRFEGVMNLGPGCDDPDSKFVLDIVDDTTFTVTGLSDNPPITFKVTGPKTAEATDVRQFGKPGHKLVFTIGNGDALIMSAESSQGSCSAPLSK